MTFILIVSIQTISKLRTFFILGILSRNYHARQYTIMTCCSGIYVWLYIVYSIVNMPVKAFRYKYICTFVLHTNLCRIERFNQILDLLLVYIRYPSFSLLPLLPREFNLRTTFNETFNQRRMLVEN